MLILHLRVNLDALEQLIHLIVAELLTQAGEYISQLSCTDETVAILIKHLEAANELLWCPCGLESVWSIEDVEEGCVVYVLWRGVGQVGNLGLGRVLAQCTEEIAERLAGDGTGSLLVKEGKCFLVLCVGLSHQHQHQYQQSKVIRRGKVSVKIECTDCASACCNSPLCIDVS